MLNRDAHFHDYPMINILEMLSQQEEFLKVWQLIKIWQCARGLRTCRHITSSVLWRLKKQVVG